MKPPNLGVLEGTTLRSVRDVSAKEIWCGGCEVMQERMKESSPPTGRDPFMCGFWPTKELIDWPP